MLERYEEGYRDRDIIAEVAAERKCSRKDAEKYVRDHVPKESVYQKKVMEGLKREFPDAYVVKVAQGQYSTAGIPDVMCIVGGQYFGFEIKRPIFGVISPLQRRTAELIGKAGGIVGFVTYPEEAVGIVRRICHERLD